MDTLIRFTFQFTLNILSALQFIIFVVVIMSWFRPRDNQLTIFLKSIARPVLSLAQRVTPRLGVIDFSPLVALLGLDLLRLAVYQIFSSLA